MKMQRTHIRKGGLILYPKTYDERSLLEVLSVALQSRNSDEWKRVQVMMEGFAGCFNITVQAPDDGPAGSYNLRISPEGP